MSLIYDYPPSDTPHIIILPPPPSTDNKEPVQLYKRQLEQWRTQINDYHTAYKSMLEERYPSTKSYIRQLQSSNIGAMKHIWGLTKENLDYGVLRIGIGKIPSPLHYEIKWNSNLGTDLVYRSLDLCQESRTVSDAPVIVSLLPENGHKAVHIYGEEDLVYSTIQTMLLQLTLRYSPVDLSVSILASEHTGSRWRWFEDIYQENTSNHVWFEEGGRNYWEHNFFRHALETLRARKKNLSYQPLSATPLWIIVFDLFNADWQSNFHRVDQKRLFYELLTVGNQLRIIPIILSRGNVRLPNLDYTQLELFHTDISGCFRLHDPNALSQMRIGQLEPSIEPQLISALADKFAVLNDLVSPRGKIPSSLTLLDIFKSRDIDELDISARWKHHENNIDWLSVPIGVDESGETVSLEFSAYGSGTHGLIAGAIGTGKSELLTTLIMGLSVNYSPQLVNFILVDYKGSVGFWQFDSLPHCIEVVTNLSQNRVLRFFRVIRAEMERRSRIVADSLTKHIVDYQSRRYHHSQEPMPFLVIIIDDFAEMIAANPEYEQELKTITRLGRALGVHLILAAQRPISVLTDQFTANIKFRIGLRMETAEDSEEMLQVPDAANLPVNIPGRAYLKIGVDDVELIQIAYSSGRYKNDDNDDGFGKFSSLSEVLIEKLRNIPSMNSNSNVPLKTWTNPLPSFSEYNYHELMRKQLEENMHNSNSKIAVGLLDFYTHYEGIYIDISKSNCILFGEEHTGKTTFLQTFVLESIQLLDPNTFQIYLIDMGGGDLSNLRGLSHIGGYISRIETDRIERLLSGLQKLVHNRRVDLESAHIEDYFAYNQNHPDDLMIPVIVIIDEIDALMRWYPNLVGKYLSTILRYGRFVGIQFVVTSGTMDDSLENILYHFEQRLCLRLESMRDIEKILRLKAWEIDYSVGRGITVVDKQAYEFQIAPPLEVGWVKAKWANTTTNLPNILEATMPSRFFISYRKADSGMVTDRIHEKLVEEFGQDKVFLDIGSISKGDEWAETILNELEHCTALIAIIGRDWLSITDEDGRRRLDNPNDWVRIEVETALRRGILLVPVLVNDAPFPSEDELPGDLLGLLSRQILRVSREDFAYDMDKLIKALRKA